MTTSGAERSSGPVSPRPRPSLEEQARRLGTRPIESAETYAVDGLWESDAEVEEFIHFTYAARKAESA